MPSNMPRPSLIFSRHSTWVAPSSDAETAAQMPVMPAPATSTSVSSVRAISDSGMSRISNATLPWRSMSVSTSRTGMVRMGTGNTSWYMPAVSPKSVTPALVAGKPSLASAILGFRAPSAPADAAAASTPARRPSRSCGGSWRG